MTMLRSWMLVCLLVLAGCVSTPEARFYTLSSPPGPPSTDAAGKPTHYSVAIGPISVPETVDRPQFVIRRTDHRLDIVEQHRWAQPLHREIADALAIALDRRLPQARVAPYDVPAVHDPDCRVLMDIERFDAVLDGAVTVQGWWTVRCHAQPARTARFIEQEAAHGGFDAIAAAYARVLSAIGGKIAEAVTALQDGK